MMVANVIWLIIVTNAMNISSTCWDENSHNLCGDQPYAFWVTLCVSFAIIGHFVYISILVAAKLHKTSHKFSLKQTETMAVDLDAKKVWSELVTIWIKPGAGHFVDV